jgi:hypothetical protein
VDIILSQLAITFHDASRLASSSVHPFLNFPVLVGLQPCTFLQELCRTNVNWAYSTVSGNNKSVVTCQYQEETRTRQNWCLTNNWQSTAIFRSYAVWIVGPCQVTVIYSISDGARSYERRVTVIIMKDLAPYLLQCSVFRASERKWLGHVRTRFQKLR